MWTFTGVFLKHGAKSVWAMKDLPGRVKIAAAREALGPQKKPWGQFPCAILIALRCERKIWMTKSSIKDLWYK